MTMPVMEPDLDAAVLRDWARTIDDGPFSSLCWGERMAFDNPETLTLMGALAAWTDRVRLVTTVIVPQLHDPVMLAKALATGDMMSRGRLTVGLGVGGRVEDYVAVGADPATQTIRGMAERVAVMKRVWAGEKITESTLPVGPAADAGWWAAAAGRDHRAQDAAQRGGVGRRSGGNHAGPRRRQAERVVRRRAPRVGRGRQAQAAPGHVVLVRAGARRGRPRAGAPASAALHELDTRRVHRRDGTDHRLRRQRGRPDRGIARIRSQSAPTRFSSSQRVPISINSDARPIW